MTLIAPCTAATASPHPTTSSPSSMPRMSLQLLLLLPLLHRLSNRCPPSTSLPTPPSTSPFSPPLTALSPQSTDPVLDFFTFHPLPPPANPPPPPEVAKGLALSDTDRHNIMPVLITTDVCVTKRRLATDFGRKRDVVKLYADADTSSAVAAAAAPFDFFPFLFSSPFSPSSLSCARFAFLSSLCTTKARPGQLSSQGGHGWAWRLALWFCWPPL